jgi:malate synthase
MTTRPKRKKAGGAKRKATAKKSRKQAAAKTKAKTKAVAKTRGAKPARRRKRGAAKKAARPRAKPSVRTKAAAKAPKRSARRRLAAFAPSGRRNAAAGRGPARGRVSPRRQSSKPAARVPRAAGVAIKGAMGPRYAEVLSPAALRFLADLHREFEGSRKQTLAAPAAPQPHEAELPEFRPGTKVIRDDPEASVAPVLADLRDRRVAIVRPADRRTMREAFNSGTAFVADFADAAAPTWAAGIDGQINLKDRWTGKLDFVEVTRREHVSDQLALIVRPRNWRQVEQHLTIDGEPISAALFDFGLCFFHTARAQLAAGAFPCFDLPQLATHAEARLWNEVLAFAQERFGLATGTIRAFMSIENPLTETPTALFELIV